MEGLKFLIEGIRQNRTQFLLLLGFALFPIYTSMADLPFWNDIAMRIMLLGMAAMGLNLVLGYGGMVSFGHAAFVGIGAYCVVSASIMGCSMAGCMCLWRLVLAVFWGWSLASWHYGRVASISS